MKTMHKTMNGSPKAKAEGSSCEHCGARGEHLTCPVCDGRGCVTQREIAEKLGLSKWLDATELTTEAVAKAFDAKCKETMKQAEADARKRFEEKEEAERKLRIEDEKKNEALLRDQEERISELANAVADAQQRAKTAEEALQKRRQQPAAVGRAAERDFAAVVGAQPDFRVSDKLPRNGDYEVWFSARGSESGEPVLVDIKRDSSALTKNAFDKLIRDCRARGRAVGILVADRIEEVHEIFGSQRVVTDGEQVVLLTSINDFCSDLRLLGVYFSRIITARIANDLPLITALDGLLAEMAEVIAELDGVAQQVAGTLEKQADVLRDVLATKLAERIRHLIMSAQSRISEASKTLATAA